MQTIDKQLETIKKKKEVGFRVHPGNINRKGRPANPEKRQLQNALKDASRNHGNVEFLHHIADLAYTDKSVALAVLDKLVPNNQLPKEQDESNGVKQIIIIRPERGREEAQVLSRPVRVQSETISRDVEFVGNGKDHVLNIAGNVIQRAPREQSGGDLPQGVHRPEELNGQGL